MRASIYLILAAAVGCDLEDSKDTDTGDVEAVNTAPEAPGVSLSPSPAYTTDDLEVVLVESTDAEGDVLTYRYEWTVGGTSIDLGGVESVSADQTARGQTWAVSVYASDGEFESPAGEASIEISNTAPTIDSASLKYDVPTTNGTLTCASGVTADADGDVVSVTYAWDVDGSPAAGKVPEVLTGDAFSKGELVTCSVTPNDGSDAGEPATASLLIENTPPEAPELGFSPERPDGTEDLICLVTADSPDDDFDAISYTMDWTVDGVAYPDGVSGAAGPSTTTWDGDTVPAADLALGEEWTCTATPNDGDDDGTPASADVSVRSSCETLTVAFLPGWAGTYTNGSVAWADVVANQASYGDCTVSFVDVSSNFSYGDLVKTGAEVIVAADVGGGTTTYTAKELAAVSDYLSKGHGGIVLTYAVSYSTYLNDDLVEWVGIDPTTMTSDTVSVSTTMSVLDTSHPLATGLTSKTVSPGGYANSQELSTSWSKALLSGADIVMENSDQSAVVVAYEDAWRGVWFTWMIEYSSTTTDGEQMIYNGLVWAAGYTP